MRMAQSLHPKATVSRNLISKYLTATEITPIWLNRTKEIQFHEASFLFIVVQPSDGKSRIILKLGANIRISKLQESRTSNSQNNTNHNPKTSLVKRHCHKRVYLINHMLLGKIIDQTLQVRGVMCQSVIIVKPINLYVIQSQILINIYPYTSIITQNQSVTKNNHNTK